MTDKEALKLIGEALSDRYRAHSTEDNASTVLAINQIMNRWAQSTSLEEQTHGR